MDEPSAKDGIPYSHELRVNYACSETVSFS